MNAAQVPKGFWSKIENQKAYIQWLEQQLNINKKEDWYHVTTKQIYQNDGTLLTVYYNGSIFTMLQHIYPTFQFLPWKFDQVPKGFWPKIENQKTYITWLEQQLNINKKEDWYHVTTTQIFQYHGRHLLTTHYD